MKGWWQRRSVRLRLALWYAAATALVLIAFAWFVYEVIEHRLAAEIDRQLRIDFDLVEAQLGVDMEGHVVWTVRGSRGSFGSVPGNNQDGGLCCFQYVRRMPSRTADSMT